MKRISIIGATGSIGKQTLDVALEQGLSVEALAARTNADLLEQQVRRFGVKFAALQDEAAAAKLRDALSDTFCKVETGDEGVCRAAAWGDSELVVNAAVGIAGLGPTVTALENGKALALANKESLVCAGELVMPLAKRKKLPILPVDSEHSAIFQCLRAGQEHEVEELLLTASGGPFFGKKAEELETMTAADALKHPTWSMGSKITIESATMMNKGFEIVEAAWLFGVPSEKISVVVHRESIIHSMVRFRDGSVIAQLGTPDMRLPIQYAINYPDRVATGRPGLDFSQISKMTFFQPDTETFPATELCRRILTEGGNLGAVVNGANEQAVALFLEGKIGFMSIQRLVRAAADSLERIQNPTLADIYRTDALARQFVLEKAVNA